MVRISASPKAPTVITQNTVLMDTATGVHYLFASSGNAGGLCPLVDRDGKPLAWDK